MAQNITIAGASFSDVPSIEVPKTGGGVAHFYDVQGTLSITANGTVDVTEYANASVNVQPSNSRHASVTVASNITSAVKIYDFDSVTAQHISDDTFVASVMFTDAYTASASRVMAICGNRIFIASYGIYGYVSGASATKISPASIGWRVDNVSNGFIRAKSDGLYVVGTSGQPWRAGTYSVDISW